MNNEFRQEVIQELVRLNPFLQGLTEDDAAIWAVLALGQQYIDDRCVALAAVHMDRRLGAYAAPDVMLRHTENMARESVANNPMYPAQRVYWQARDFDRNGAPRVGEPAPF